MAGVQQNKDSATQAKERDSRKATRTWDEWRERVRAFGSLRMVYNDPHRWEHAKRLAATAVVPNYHNNHDWEIPSFMGEDMDDDDDDFEMM